MTLTRLLLRSLRRPSPLQPTITSILKTLTLHPQPTNTTFLIPFRSFCFSSAERHRLCKLNALKRPSALVGPCLSLHDSVLSSIRHGDLDDASVVARQSVFSNTLPTVFTCNVIIGSMYRAKRYTDAIALFTYFFKQWNIIPNVVSYNFLIVSYCDNGEVDKGLEVYQHIKENVGFGPSVVTFRHLHSVPEFNK